MKKIQAYILFLLYLFSAVSCANEKESDNLTLLYRTITEEALPGISDFIEPLIKEDTGDYSDYWFTSSAKCAYLSWAHQVNRAIAKRQDTPDNGRLIPDEEHWQAAVTEYCHNMAQDKSATIPDISVWKPLSPHIPYFPIKRFISEADTMFSPFESYVQNMPSYEMLTFAGFHETFESRKRIILETLLQMLGRTVYNESTNSLWSNFYTARFRDVMSQFHCSRFIERSNPDLIQFRRCLSEQSDADVQRSKQADILTDIALGKFITVKQDSDSFDAYGYQQGFAFAESRSGFQKSRHYMAGYSVIAETIVLITLIRGALLR